MRRPQARVSSARPSRSIRECAFEPLEDRRLLAAVFRDGEILVQFAPAASAAEKSVVRAAVQGRALEAIETAAMRSQGSGTLERISLGRGVSVERAIEVVSNRPGVVFAEPNWRFSNRAVSDDPFYTTSSRLWGMYGDDQPVAAGPSGTTNEFGSQAEKAWAAGVTGSRTVFVGIVDEGVDVLHPDLAANMWVNPFEVVGDGLDNDGNGYVDDVRGWDFYANDASVFDGGGDDHGTHVAGTIGGVGGNGAGVVGVSWNVTMIPTKFMGADGGYTSGAIKALDYLTDLKTRHGINVVASNNSWGGGGYSSALHSAIIRGANAGILFVAAAGNSAVDTDASANYPSNYSTLQGTSTTRAASYEAVLSVAALTSNGGLASFSSYGATSVDIAAPGAGITSTVPGGGYAAWSGTSMAAPHVAGTVALVASAHPAAGAAAIRGAILTAARPTASLNGKVATGGRLDVAAALNALASPPPPAVTPALSISSVSGPENAGSFVFTVSLSAASATSVSVRFATSNGTATSSGRGADYSAASGTLTFNPGETTKTVTVAVRNDSLVEADETFFVTLSKASGATISVSRGTGTIVNDDGLTAAAFAALASAETTRPQSRRR